MRYGRGHHPSIMTPVPGQPLKNIDLHITATHPPTPHPEKHFL